MMLLLKVVWSQWWQPTPVVDKNCISHAFNYSLLMHNLLLLCTFVYIRVCSAVGSKWPVVK